MPDANVNTLNIDAFRPGKMLIRTRMLVRMLGASGDNLRRAEKSWRQISFQPDGRAARRCGINPGVSSAANRLLLCHLSYKSREKPTWLQERNGN